MCVMCVMKNGPTRTFRGNKRTSRDNFFSNISYCILLFHLFIHYCLSKALSIHHLPTICHGFDQVAKLVKDMCNKVHANKIASILSIFSTFLGQLEHQFHLLSTDLEHQPTKLIQISQNAHPYHLSEKLKENFNSYFQFYYKNFAN